MSTPRPRPAPVTNQTFLSLMLLHVLLLESCRSARTDLRCRGSPLCTPTQPAARKQPSSRSGHDSETCGASAICSDGFCRSRASSQQRIKSHAQVRGADGPHAQALSAEVPRDVPLSDALAVFVAVRGGADAGWALRPEGARSMTTEDLLSGS
jgi:hypothetical protein